MLLSVINHNFMLKHIFANSKSVGVTIFINNYNNLNTGSHVTLSYIIHIFSHCTHKKDIKETCTLGFINVQNLHNGNFFAFCDPSHSVLLDSSLMVHVKLHLRHHLFHVLIPSRLLVYFPPPTPKREKSRCRGMQSAGGEGFTKNDGLKLSCVIIFHTLGYREIDK